MKLLPMSTDPRGSWRLSDRPDTPASKPGESIRIESSFAGPLAFVGLRVGPDRRLWIVGPNGLSPATTPGLWRVDEITIDGSPCEAAVKALEAEALSRVDGRVLSVQGDFGVGSAIAIRATNIGEIDAYFYAVWEIEDVQ
jgi:hypothetical protein